MKLVHQYLFEIAQQFSSKTAIICDEKKLSYEELFTKICDLSSAFIDAGLRKGDRVMLLLSDKVDFIVASLAVIASGAIAVPLLEDTIFSTIELIAADCAPFLLVTGVNDIARYPFLQDRITCNMMFMGKSDSQSINYSSFNEMGLNFLRQQSAIDSVTTQHYSEDDEAFILYFPGSTVGRKGVVLTHRNLIQATLHTNEFMQIDSNIREYVALPLMRSLGFGRVRSVLFVGGTLVLHNGIANPLSLVENVIKHRCDAISSIPSGLTLFFGRLEPSLRQIGPQIRFIELGGSQLALDHKIKLLDIFSYARICMHYGFSEASRSTFIDFRSELRKLNTSGQPSPNVSISICDDNGKVLDRMAMGEILIHGDHVAAGYWQDHRLTRQRFPLGNWFKTGEVGFLDEESYLHILGSKDEVISMDSLRISPLEVEEKIHELYPDCQICVVGVPDPEGLYGEIPVLCYTARNGRSIAPSELSRALADRLDRNNIPRIVYRIDRFPKTNDGKIARKELRRKLIEGLVSQIEHVEWK